MKIEIEAKLAVIVTENHGGYTGGRCIACGAVGWLVETPYGLPFNSPPANSMRHEKSCPMNAALTDDGKLRD